jgi:hypothetical protein
MQREEQILCFFENEALMRIRGPNREVIKGECRKLHKDELQRGMT